MDMAAYPEELHRPGGAGPGPLSRATQRYAGHLNANRTDEELWGAGPPAQARPGGAVDASGTVDIGRLSDNLARAVARGLGGRAAGSAASAGQRAGVGGPGSAGRGRRAGRRTDARQRKRCPAEERDAEYVDVSRQAGADVGTAGRRVAAGPAAGPSPGRRRRAARAVDADGPGAPPGRLGGDRGFPAFLAPSPARGTPGSALRTAAQRTAAQRTAAQRLATSDCLARTAAAAVRRPASSASVRSRSTTRRMPTAPISASTPR